MTSAVAKMLGVDAKNIVLAFDSVTLERRGQETGVLVRAGIIGFQGTAASLASKVTQDKLDTEMLALGLNSGKLVYSTGMTCDEFPSLCEASRGQSAKSIKIKNIKAVRKELKSR